MNRKQKLEVTQEEAAVELVPENTAPEPESTSSNDSEEVPMQIEETEEEETLNEVSIEELGEYDPTLELSQYQRPSPQPIKTNTQVNALR